MAEETKRYVVTFRDPAISNVDAAGILGVRLEQVKEGIALLGAAEAPADTDVCHFRDIGTCTVRKTSGEAEKLKGHNLVEEVVEDFEVFALTDTGCCGDSAEMGDEAAGLFGPEEDPYVAGYERAMADLQGGMPPGAEAPDQGAAARFPFPPWPRWPPLPPPPPRPRPCPPGTRRVCLRLHPWWPPLCICIPDRRLPPPPLPIPWNISLVGADKAWRRVTGRGVKVAVIDTGIDNDHPDLSVAGGVSVVPGVADWDDDHRHGTHCAGIIGARKNRIGVVGVAPDCSLYAVKVLDSRGRGYLGLILAGMGWAAQEGMQVASMSLGSPASTPDARCTAAYQRAAERLNSIGCIVVAASGNYGRPSNPNPWVGQPARCPAFMAVGAVDRNSNRAPFSSYEPPSLGPNRGVEIVAPGVSVRSTVPGGGYKEMSGTSMACPHVAGGAALLCEQHPNWSPDQVRDRLKQTAADLGVPGDDPEYGAGLLDCNAAVFAP